ncbi:MAG TPA: hypothetical protein VNP04_13285 [Alphaproteobacteria bacterium]|nr:hypothetical protein [Alphaproteobacteria bacterium]
MSSTVHLFLTDTRTLRNVRDEGDVQGIPDARDIGPPDRDPIQSERLLASIQKTCAEMSVVVKEESERFELDKRGYIVGIPDADIVTTIAASAASATVMTMLLRTIRVSIEQWLKNRASRRVRLRIGDRQVEIQGTNDITAAIEALRSLEKPPTRRRPVSKRTAKTRPKKR